MTIAATYINSAQFSVEGDQLNFLNMNQKIILVQTPDDDLYTKILAILYDAGTDKTIATVYTTEEEFITSNLSEVLRGPTFNNTTTGRTNQADHFHPDEAFGLITDDDVATRLNSMGAVGASVADFIQCINSLGTDVEKRELLGTSDQITITFAEGTITLSLPQSIATDSTPEFSNAILSSLQGIVTAGSDGTLAAINPSANQIVRKNVAGTALEAADLSLQNLKDVYGTPSAEGQVPTWSVSGDRFEYSIPAGGTGGGGASLPLIYSIATMLKGSGGGTSTVSISSLDGDKLVIDWEPANYTPTDVDETELTTELAAHLKGVDLALLSPDLYSYCPKPVLFKSDSQLTLQAGDYYALGYRHRGEYERHSTTKITVASNTDVTISSAISGGKPNDSWFSVFLRNPSSPGLLILPYIHVKASSYVSGSTRVEIGSHLDHEVANDDFLTAADQWNSYRLMKISYDAYDGYTYDIATSVTTSGDYVTIVGDKTTEILAGDWLAMIPDSTDDFVYLGVIYINTGWNLEHQMRQPGTWDYPRKHIDAPWIAGNSSDEADNTSLIEAVSPNAHEAQMAVTLMSGSTDVTGLEVTLYGGASLEVCLHDFVTAGAEAVMSNSHPVRWFFSHPATVRNSMIQEVEGEWEGVSEGYFEVYSYSE